MMQEFSRRTINGLKHYRLFKLLLPPFQSFLESNVLKEIEKDRYVIQQAARACRKGTPPGEPERQWLLEKAKEVDRQFVHRSGPLPLSIDIRYQDIEQIRGQRIGRMLGVAYHVLVAWERIPGLRRSLASLYDKQQFRALLLEILDLYIQETRLLSNSIKLPRKLLLARDSVLKTVYQVMERTADDLAAELAGRMYR